MFDFYSRKGKREGEQEYNGGTVDEGFQMGPTKKRRADPDVDQEYEDELEGGFCTGDTSTSSSSSSFVTPGFGKHKYSESYIYEPSSIPQAKSFSPSPQEVKLLASLAKSSSEKKYIDIAGTFYDGTVTPTIVLLNGVATGSSNVTRVGNQVNWESIQLSGQLTPVDDTTVRGKFALWVIWDNQPNGALPSVTDVLTAATANSFINYDVKQRFIPLIHRTWVFGTISNVAGQTISNLDIADVNIYKKINRRTTYKGVTAAIGDVATGSLLLLPIGISGSAYYRLYAAIRLVFTE